MAFEAQAPAFGQRRAAGDATSVGQYPSPPNLHWTILLLLSIVTLGVFAYVWMLVQAAYVRKIDRDSKAMLFYGIAIACVVLGIASQVYEVPIGGLLNLVALVLTVMAHFNMKGSIEAHFTANEPYNLQLSGPLTFFLNIVYFQYHFNKINQWRKSAAAI